MFQVILYILFLSAIGIIAFIIFLNNILNKTFSLPQIELQKTPADFSIEYKELFINTKQHKKVQVWDINPSHSKSIIIAMHGWANNSDSFLSMAEPLSKNIRLLLVNARNHGQSDPEKYMNLIKFADDIQAVISYLEAESAQPLKVHLLGHSLGGAAALWVASKDQRVQSVTTIGTFADLETMMRNGFIKNKLFKGFIGSLFVYIEFRIGAKMSTISPQNTAAVYKGPLLLVHGTKDETVDFMDMHKIRKAAHRENVDQFVMKGYGHSELLVTKELAQAVETFIEKNKPA